MSISPHSISHYYWEQIHKLHFIILRVHLLQRRKEGNTHKRLSLSLSLSPQANKNTFVSSKPKLMVAVETNFFNQPTPAIPKTHPMMQTKKMQEEEGEEEEGW
jgi:hypothetical protein